jgi:hypothetical protein
MGKPPLRVDRRNLSFLAPLARTGVRLSSCTLPARSWSPAPDQYLRGTPEKARRRDCGATLSREGRPMHRHSSFELGGPVKFRERESTLNLITNVVLTIRRFES